MGNDESLKIIRKAKHAGILCTTHEDLTNLEHEFESFFVLFLFTNN